MSRNSTSENGARSTFEDAWRRAAQSASTIHNVRNRLQSIIIEAAVLRRTASGVDPAICDRIKNFAHEGAEFLEVFSQLLPSPALSGSTTLASAAARLAEFGLSVPESMSEVAVGCSGDAVETILEVTFAELLPERGCRPASAGIVSASGGRVALSVELHREGDAPRAAGRTATWSLLQQMMRNLGGVVEFEERQSPVLRLIFPAPQAKA